MLILFFSFLIFIALVPVAHGVILTVNEEFFVFASFFIFIDLFGLTFTKLISDSIAPMQQRIALRFRTFLEADLAMQANLHSTYIELSQLVSFTTTIRKQFYEELYNLVKQRNIDSKSFIIQSKIIAYKIIHIYELDLERFCSYLTVRNCMQALHSSLNQLSVRMGGVSKTIQLTQVDQTVQLLASFED